MQSLLVLTIVSCLAAYASAFFLSPDIYNPQPANRTICQSDAADLANAPTSANRIPYLSCSNQGHLKIASCRLLLTNSATCPLNFPGADGSRGFPVTARVLTGEEHLIGLDCTRELTDLCGSQTECSFQWSQLGTLRVEANNGNISNVFTRQQGALVVYTCADKRNKCK